MRITHDRRLAQVGGFMNPEAEAHKDWQVDQLAFGITYGKSKAKAYRDTLDNLFSRYAFPGGYEILFTIADDPCILCNKCAREAYLDGYDVNCGIYYEGPTEYCEECGEEIESAYGDPNEDEEDLDEEDE